jgi:hypothetical protein
MPDGQIRFSCPALFEKIFRFACRANHLYKLVPSCPEKRGVGHRHERWGRLRWTRQRQARKGIAGRVSRERPTGAQTNGAEAYGKTVWSWHPLLVSSRRRFCEPDRVQQIVNSPTTVTRRIRRRGERGIRRKTIAQGRPVPRLIPVCSCAHSCALLAHETAGASQHPAFPAPSVFRGRRFLAHLGRIAPREGGTMFGMATQPPYTRCHHPRMRVIQYAAASRLNHCCHWNTGSPGQAGRRPQRVKLNRNPSTSLRGACDDRVAEALRAKAEAIHTFVAARWIASRSLSSGAHSRDPLDRNDGDGGERKRARWRGAGSA